jgi:DNA-binding MarR family transcriptional regulator
VLKVYRYFEYCNYFGAGAPVPWSELASFPMPHSASKQAAAAIAWRRLFDFFVGTSWRREEVLERAGLTANDAKALHTLDLTEGRRMRALADTWGTDASNATWVVDRLERKGLARRLTHEPDRRVKLVVLTPRGARVRDELRRAFLEPPPELLALGRDELRRLGDILEPLASPVDTSEARGRTRRATAR